MSGVSVVFTEANKTGFLNYYTWKTDVGDYINLFLLLRLCYLNALMMLVGNEQGHLPSQVTSPNVINRSIKQGVGVVLAVIHMFVLCDIANDVAAMSVSMLYTYY